MMMQQMMQIVAFFVSMNWLCLTVPMRDTVKQDWSYVLPFTRQLQYFPNKEIHGKDVIILQNLLQRCPGISLNATSYFDENTKVALTIFQKLYKISPSDGVFRNTSAKVLLDNFLYDNFKDDGKIPRWCKFKMYVPVHRNRSIETIATLFDGNGNVLHKFPVRAHGGFGSKSQSLNQLTRYGNTPTGLSTLDLNSPEPIDEVKKYGPYPVLRVVKGLKGNSAIRKENSNKTFLSNFRSGILLHTGIWVGWNKTQPMPNSHGCLKTHPDDMKTIVNLLISKTGAIANKNPFGKLPYPYSPQGIIAIEQID